MLGCKSRGRSASDQSSVRNARRAHGLPVLAAAVASAISASSDAAILQYTMNFGLRSGTYGGTSFTNQQLTLTFLYDTAAVVDVGASTQQANFINGRGAGGQAIRVTLGSILTNAAVDDDAANTSAIQSGHTGSSVTLRFGKLVGSTYSSVEYGQLVVTSGFPAANAVLTTEWTSPAGVYIVNDPGWGNTPLVIGGSDLLVTVPQGGPGGSWGAVTSVPGAGLSVVASLGFAGIVRRRRR